MKFHSVTLWGFIACAVTIIVPPVSAGGLDYPVRHQSGGSGAHIIPVVQAVLDAPTTAYVGLTAADTTLSSDGMLRSTQCPGACSLTVGLPGSASSTSYSFIVGARNVTESGFFMGAEIFFTQSGGSTETTTTYDLALPGFNSVSATYRQSVNFDREIGARLIAGYELADCRLFGMVGLASSSANISLSTDLDGTFGRHNTSLTGATFGFGAEYDITQHASIRADLSSTYYDDVEYGTRLNGSHSIDLENSRIALGIIFRN